MKRRTANIAVGRIEGVSFQRHILGKGATVSVDLWGFKGRVLVELPERLAVELRDRLDVALKGMAP